MFYFLATTHQMATEQKWIIFYLKLKVTGVKHTWDSKSFEKWGLFWKGRDCAEKKSKRLRVGLGKNFYVTKSCVIPMWKILCGILKNNS